MEDTIECSSCDEEFRVENKYNSDSTHILFCPYCGSSIMNDSDDLIDEEDVDEDYRD